MRVSSFAQLGSYCLLQVVLSSEVPAVAQAQSTPVSESSAVTTLAGDVQAMLADFAAQRDQLGGWPARVQEGYDALTQLKTQLDNARAAGDASMARRRYRQLMKVASRISRWLVNQYDPANDQLPGRDKVVAIVARFQAQIDLLTQLASQAGVTLSMTGVNTAKAQVQAARANGTDAQLLAAVRALREAIDALQDSLPDVAG